MNSQLFHICKCRWKKQINFWGYYNYIADDDDEDDTILF